MVDDDEDDIFAVRRGIEASKCKFDFCAVASSEAMFAYLKDPEITLPDVLVLDVNMPRMNGFDALATLKSVDQWADIPVMMLSTSAHDADRVKAVQLGAISFSTKFSSMKDLAVWVAKLERFLQVSP